VQVVETAISGDVQHSNCFWLMKLPIWEQWDNSQEIWVTRSANGMEVFCDFADGDGFIPLPNSQNGLACVQNTLLMSHEESCTSSLAAGALSASQNYVKSWRIGTAGGDALILRYL
jgi:hypothetical protein